MNWRWLRAAIAAWVLAACLGIPSAAAQVPIQGPGGPFWGYPSWYGTPCAAPCPDARDLRRELRRELQQQEGPNPAVQPTPAPEQRPPPPPTRVEEIRPEYEGASQIREEYRRSGDRR